MSLRFVTNRLQQTALRSAAFIRRQTPLNTTTTTPSFSLWNVPSLRTFASKKVRTKGNLASCNPSMGNQSFCFTHNRSIFYPYTHFDSTRICWNMPKDIAGDPRIAFASPFVASKRLGSMPIEIGGARNENGDVFGLCDCKPVFGNTIGVTHNSYRLSKRPILNSIAKYWLKWPRMNHLPLRVSWMW